MTSDAPLQELLHKSQLNPTVVSACTNRPLSMGSAGQRRATESLTAEPCKLGQGCLCLPVAFWTHRCPLIGPITRERSQRRGWRSACREAAGAVPGRAHDAQGFPPQPAAAVGAPLNLSSTPRLLLPASFSFLAALRQPCCSVVLMCARLLPSGHLVPSISCAQGSCSGARATDALESASDMLWLPLKPLSNPIHKPSRISMCGRAGWWTRRSASCCRRGRNRGCCALPRRSPAGNWHTSPCWAAPRPFRCISNQPGTAGLILSSLFRSDEWRFKRCACSSAAVEIAVRRLTRIVPLDHQRRRHPGKKLAQRDCSGSAGL